MAIHSQFGSIDPLSAELPELVDAQVVDLAQGIRLVQFVGPVQSAWRQALKDQGVVVLGYIPDNTLQIACTSRIASALGQLPYVRVVVDQPALFKLDTRLVSSASDGIRITGVRGARDVLIEVVDAANVADVALMVQSVGGSIVNVAADGAVKPGRVLHAKVPTAQMAWVAANPDVLSVEPFVPLRVMNDIGYGIIQAATVHESPLWDAGLHGEGQTVGVCDVGVSTGSCFFPTGKITQYENVTPQNTHDTSHGTHTAGSIAGDNFGNGTYDQFDGMAPGAKLYVQDAGTATVGEMDVPDDLNANLFPNPYNAGVRIHSDSWGGDQNTYGVRERSLDQFVYEHQDFLVIIANGNTGGEASTVNAPATAKNLIAAGALNGASPEDVASFSSQGPTPDGRIKPTLMAHGVQVVSASSASVCGVETKDGTSMSAPMIAGAAALVRQYYTAGFYPTGSANTVNAMTPSAALIKATMLAGADNMSGLGTNGSFPNNTQGFGRVHLANALHFAGDSTGTWVSDERTGLDTEGSSTTTLQVQGGAPLHIALTWMDPPGAVGAVHALVNNLDLVVVGPDGSTYYGNAMSNGRSVVGGAADQFNVEEIVYLPTPTAGAYTVKVLGTNVPVGPQPFAVVASGVAGAGTTNDSLGNPASSSQSASIDSTQVTGSNAPGAGGCQNVAVSGPVWLVIAAALFMRRRMNAHQARW